MPFHVLCTTLETELHKASSTVPSSVRRPRPCSRVHLLLGVRRRTACRLTDWVVQRHDHRCSQCRRGTVATGWMRGWGALSGC